MDRPTFLLHLYRSRLLSDQQVRRVIKRLRSESPQAVISTLIADGLLTSFQARQLLRGSYRGFFLGPYRILQQIGKGGVAVVYKALDTVSGGLVALKVFRPGVHQQAAECLQSFEREVQAASALDHPNIVTVCSASRAKGVYYIVMEYVDAPSLNKLVKDRGPLEIDLACELLRQAAVALQYADERGIVHRDIKPSNMLVENAGIDRLSGGKGTRPCAAHRACRPPVLKVLDFGLARLRSTQPTTSGDAGQLRPAPGAVWGSLDFISPEQIEDVDAADIRADLYSLGCTFYHMLTGHVPFPGGTAREKLIRQCLEQPQPVARTRPDVPDAICKVVEKLMAKEPALRFPCPADVIAALPAPYRSRGEQPEDSTELAFDRAPTISDSAWDTACHPSLSADKGSVSADGKAPSEEAQILRLAPALLSNSTEP